MRATGSRFSRRSTAAPRRTSAAGSSRSPALAIEASWLRPSAWQSSSRASSSGVSMPARRNAEAAPAKALVRVTGSAMALVLHRRELGGLVLGDQRVDDLVERGFTLEHIGELMRGEADAVIGDAALREIIGADALGAVAGADLALARPGALGIELAPLEARRAARAAPSSPWPCSCAATSRPAGPPRARMADA